ncbi:MAG: SDR family NAD(P)-dependent oxidoreductase [Hyphomonadaceae bacterium]
MSLFDLTGKTALVTGGSRGIGRAIATRMAEHGAKVVICARGAEACESAAAAINATYQGAALAVPADITDKADLARLVERARAAFAKIDVLVCNAGGMFARGPLAQNSDEDIQKTWTLNVMANHWLIQLVAPEMLERGNGSIILVSSVAGLRGNPVGMATYGMTKAADLQMTRSLAVEFGPRNVRVNCIVPGLIITEMTGRNEQLIAANNARRPLAHLGEPDDCAGPAVMLASDAGRYMTGQAVIVDGGLLMA